MGLVLNTDAYEHKGTPSLSLSLSLYLSLPLSHSLFPLPHSLFSLSLPRSLSLRVSGSLPRSSLPLVSLCSLSLSLSLLSVCLAVLHRTFHFGGELLVEYIGRLLIRLVTCSVLPSAVVEVISTKVHSRKEDMRFNVL